MFTSNTPRNYCFVFGLNLLYGKKARGSNASAGGSSNVPGPGAKDTETVNLQGPLSVVAHNGKVVGALSVVGATESQIFNNFLEMFQKFQQKLIYGFTAIVYDFLKFRKNP